MSQHEVTFSFGANWKDWLKNISDERIESAVRDIREWLGGDFVRGRTVIDVGSGSGVHSLAFIRLGARAVRSFDYDPQSVEATTALWEREGRPENWTVSSGSILDKDFVKALGQFDIVYSWGVLHHTGAMWEALENSRTLVEEGGKYWISLYKKGPLYPKHLALKTRYNAASALRKRWMVGRGILRIMLSRLARGRNPLRWNEGKVRGMDVYHDLVDWLGGLPYEVATEDEIVRAGSESGLILERIRAGIEGGCSVYVFRMGDRLGGCPEATQNSIGASGLDPGA